MSAGRDDAVVIGAGPNGSRSTVKTVPHTDDGGHNLTDKYIVQLVGQHEKEAKRPLFRLSRHAARGTDVRNPVCHGG